MLEGSIYYLAKKEAHFYFVFAVYEIFLPSGYFVVVKTYLK
jgi:hypothetical protein